MADAVGECYLSAYGYFEWTQNKTKEFEGGLNFLEAFLQNLIGNIISFNMLYQNIVAANAANNTVQVYYYIGQFIYLFVNVEPIIGSPLQMYKDVAD